MGGLKAGLMVGLMGELSVGLSVDGIGWLRRLWLENKSVRVGSCCGCVCQGGQDEVGGDCFLRIW